MAQLDNVKGGELMTARRLVSLVPMGGFEPPTYAL
jgi:hypothetical protein